MSERPYKTEVYYRGRSVFKAGYHDDLAQAGRSARESLELDNSVREVKIIDHAGHVLETLEKEER